MSYIIKYEDIALLYDLLKIRSVSVNSKLINIENIMVDIISSNKYQGEYASKLKDYFNSIQLPVIRALSDFYSAYPQYVLLLVGEYMTVETSAEAVLNEDFIAELSTELQNAIEYVTDMAFNINTEINNIKDISEDIYNITSEPFINNGFGAIKENIDTLNYGIYSVEESFYNSELCKLEELYDSIMKVISKMTKIGQVDILKDDYYALFPMSDIKELEEKITAIDIEERTEYLEYLYRLCKAQESYEIKDKYTLEGLLESIKYVKDIAIELTEFSIQFAVFSNGENCGLFADVSTIEWLNSYIPNHISDDTLMYAMTLISSPLDAHTIQLHLQHNRELWMQYLKDGGKAGKEVIFQDGFIDNQDALDEMYYGVDGGSLSASYNSCEIIALYNALYAVNGGVTDPKYDFPELIAQIEGRGACLNGIFGTSPIIIEDYIEDEGYDYKTLEGDDARDEEKLDDLQSEYDAYIVTVYNNEDKITKMIHTMCITKVVVDGEMKYILRNDFEDDTIPYDSIYDCLEAYNYGDSKTICIIGIND